jgi:DNA-binding transcriptional LysR family regulator
VHVVAVAAPAYVSSRTPPADPSELAAHNGIAARGTASLGLSVSLIDLCEVLPELVRGDLIRLLPDWHADAGAISLYYASRKLISTKTRAFVDFVVNAFKMLAVAFSANH